MKYEEVLKELHSKSDPSATEKMKRFGIEVNRSLGISVPKLRNLLGKSERTIVLHSNFGIQGFTRQGF